MSHLVAMDRDWSRRLGIARSQELPMPAPGAGSFAVPGQLDHFLWRLVGTDRLKGARDLLELDERWSYTDMLDAHVWLDAIDDAVAREHAEHERAMRAAAPRRR